MPVHGFKSDPRSLGIEGENYWIYEDYDHDKVRIAGPEKPDGIYLSFPSLKMHSQYANKQSRIQQEPESGPDQNTIDANADTSENTQTKSTSLPGHTADAIIFSDYDFFAK